MVKILNQILKTVIKWLSGYVAMWLCRFLLITYSLIHLTTRLYGAFESRPPGARPLGMSAAFVGLANDTNAVFYNPAGLRLVSAFEFSTTYNQLFAVEGLQYNVFSAVMPVRKFGIAGLSFAQFGPSEFKEQTLVVSNAFALSEGLMFGYNLKGNMLKIADYGSDSSIGLDLGLLARVSENFAIGSAAKNVNEPKIGVDKIPESFSAGLFLRPLKGVSFGWDIEKIQDQTISLHFGTEFRVFQFLCFRSGIQTNPNRFSFGCGFNRRAVYIDYAYFTHPTLAADHIFSLSIKTSLEKEAVIEYKPKEKKAKKPRVSRKRKEPAQPAQPVQPAQPLKPALPPKININTASEEELTTLPGIGSIMAKRIVDYRSEKGLFKTIEDLQNVPRMSRRIYLKIEALITVGEVKP
ncbi:MAG: helix-hairpin-helix domain-containing protein [Elusimicrobiota bacterium]